MQLPSAGDPAGEIVLPEVESQLWCDPRSLGVVSKIRVITLVQKQKYSQLRW